MNSVIEVNFRTTWDSPVYVLGTDGSERAIGGPLEACRFLQDDMTIQSGHAYCSAVLVCMAAVKAPRHIKRAREAFVAAYVEYRLHLSG